MRTNKFFLWRLQYWHGVNWWAIAQDLKYYSFILQEIMSDIKNEILQLLILNNKQEKRINNFDEIPIKSILKISSLHNWMWFQKGQCSSQSHGEKHGMTPTDTENT